MIPVQATFTIPTPNVYQKWNVLYNKLQKAKIVPWRAKPAYANHYQMWFELEKEEDIEKIKDLLPKGGKVFFTNPWSQYN
jgi:hypothetical protein